MKKFISIITSIIAAAMCCSCGAGNTDKDMLGVWWWDSGLNVDTYLNFATDRGVTEIYYCDSSFGESAKSFINACKKRDINVYMLAGEYQWLRDAAPLFGLVDRYIEFNGNGDCGFDGIHLDIEPHQDPNFAVERETLLKSLVSLTFELSEKYPEIRFDYDIPFWLDDEIEYNGNTLPAYAHIIRNADRTFIMSYRDSAEAIYKTAEDELRFAEESGKTVVLGVETFSTEGDGVSFMEEGKNYMYAEMEKLREMTGGAGISVHQIKTWYDLKD